MKKIILSIVVMLSIITESSATTGAAASPVSIYYSVNTNAPISVTWSVTGGAALHSSTVGTFINPATGKPISADNIVSTLNINCVIGAQSILCNTAPESFTLPHSVIAGAQKLGITTINYSRTFTDGTPSTATVKINLLNTNLSISRESLRFYDNSNYKLVKPTSRLYASAELKYTGTGLLDAFWEVAELKNNIIKPIYTRLSSLRKYLGAGGRITLQSPQLPTFTTGQYIVRLQILKTSSNPQGVIFTNYLPEGLPVLRYNVIGNATNKSASSLSLLKTKSPHNNTLLQTDTIFSWQAVKGTKAYQLELYLENKDSFLNDSDINLPIDDSIIKNQKPATGLLIPAKKTSLMLSTLAIDMLMPQKTYYWRIIAIGKNGQLLSTSLIKKIRIP